MKDFFRKCYQICKKLIPKNYSRKALFCEQWFQYKSYLMNVSNGRSSHPEVFLEDSVLKICDKFTR